MLCLVLSCLFLFADDSSFYFHAGIFQNPVSGITHMCSYPPNSADEPAHPPCLGNTTQWSVRILTRHGIPTYSFIRNYGILMSMRSEG